MKWACGLTTVPSRRRTLLPLTLASLCRAGFSDLRLFVDGDKDAVSWENEFKLPVTSRFPAVLAYGNWALTLGELLIRNPDADRVAIFQDDFVCCLQLREYLETFDLPDDHYLNLYTFPKNLKLCGDREGWSYSDQRGRGAVALVFTRKTAAMLLAHPITTHKPFSVRNPTRNIDGHVSNVLCDNLKFKELIHNPSLTQHLGHVTTIRNNDRHAQADSWRGEEFNPYLQCSSKELLRSALLRKR